MRTIFSRKENRVFIPIIIIIFLLILYSLSSIFLSAPSRPQLSAYSDGWDDVSSFKSELERNEYEVASIISTPTILSKFNREDYRHMVYLAIGIERPYTEDDANTLWNFMRYGGNIIIADDFGYGNTFWDNSITSGYGRVEFEKSQLFDPSYIKNTTFVSVNATLPGPSKQYSLLLNEPTALKKSYGAFQFTTLGSSSDGSWLDDNGNRVRDPLEPKVSYPVIVSFSSSNINGKAFFISDPGLFINENWNFLNNAEFAMDLIHYILPTGGVVIFDESRHISENTFENARRTVYTGAVFLTSSIWRIVLTVVIVISFTLLVGVKLKPQKLWKNQNMLNVKYFNILNYPYITQYDHWQIYNTFMEKVRHSYGFSPDEFKELDEKTMKNLVGNDHLWDFIIQKQYRYINPDYYRNIIYLMSNWLPIRPEEFKEIENNYDNSYLNEHNDREETEFNQPEQHQSQALGEVGEIDHLDNYTWRGD
jgi:hypothetical protein